MTASALQKVRPEDRKLIQNYIEPKKRAKKLNSALKGLKNVLSYKWCALLIKIKEALPHLTFFDEFQKKLRKTDANHSSMK